MSRVSPLVHSDDMPPEPEPTRMVREKPAPYSYTRKPGRKIKGDNDTSETSSTKQKRDNLTLNDWMTVFAFIDSHPDMGQVAIVQHFKSKATDALVFTQSTLSRKIKQRKQLEDRVHSTPNALQSKRPRVVTRPDVERALVLWLQTMRQKGVKVTGPMLVDTRKRFEDVFMVPERERLSGPGWVASFRKAYGANNNADGTGDQVPTGDAGVELIPPGQAVDHPHLHDGNVSLGTMCG